MALLLVALIYTLYEGDIMSQHSGTDSVVVRNASGVLCSNHAIRNTRYVIQTRGMTLVEVMLAAAVIVVAALGTLCYEYLCVDHIRFARVQMAATRVGQLVIEDWKSTGGSSDYDPEDLAMGFRVPPGAVWGDYMTVIDDVPLYIGMSQSDVARDDFAGVTLRRIDVSIRWRKNFSYGSPDNDDPAVNLTTYVRQDQ